MEQLEGSVCSKCQKGKLHGVRSNGETATYQCDFCNEEIPTAAKVKSAGAMDPQTMQFK